MADRRPVDLNQEQAREILGIGLPRLKKLQKENGCPTPRPGKGTIDGRELVKWWVDFQTRAVLGVSEPGDQPAQGKIIEQDERARWYKARADAQERENAIASAEYVSADVVEQLLEQPIAELAAALDALPSQIKAAITHLRAAEVDQVATMIARMRNNLARHEFSIKNPA